MGICLGDTTERRAQPETKAKAMETKVKKLAELNSLRDRHADQVLAENPNSVSRVSVTMDKSLSRISREFVGVKFK